jgi:hypothetical protein
LLQICCPIGITRQQATEQFVRATETYQQSGIQSPGFRCPYLSYSESARQAARDTQFTYSSNQAIWWDVVSPQAVQGATPVFEQLRQFYRADAAADVVSTPMLADGLVEIPTSLPDDLQLYDGLKLGEQGLAQAWLELHQQVYRRGEMAVILFHPESFYQCAPAFDQLLRAARDYQPAVWVARLRDIADWWWEKSRFQVASTTDTDHLRLTFECSDRATIVIRDLETDMPTQPWYGAYRIVEGRTGRFSADVRPFIGVASDVPPHTISFLQEQGHIVETGAEARRCGTYLDGALIERLTTQVQLIEHIEAAATPLVRFWRWPQGYRSVLSITGDLDALSLLDYVGRLLPRK